MPNFAVIFDMDGVICDTNPTHKTALIQFCKKYGYDLTEEQLRTKIYGRTNKDWLANLFGELSHEQFLAYEVEKESLFIELYKPIVKPLVGLRDFIQMLRNQAIPVSIGTSAPRMNVDFILTHIDFPFDWFSAILDETFVDKGKPHPEIYLKVAQTLNYLPTNCIVFEDSIAGVQSGKAAGCKVVGVTTTHTPEELRAEGADWTIGDFTEVKLEDLENLFL